MLRATRSPMRQPPTAAVWSYARPLRSLLPMPGFLFGGSDHGATPLLLLSVVLWHGDVLQGGRVGALGAGRPVAVALLQRQHPRGHLAAGGADDIGHGPQLPGILLREEGHRVAGAPSATCAPDAVDVVGGGVREVEVDDCVDAQKVHAAAHEVRGDQDPGPPRAKALHRRAAGRLALVRVDAIHVELVVHELLVQRHRAFLGRHKHQHRRSHAAREQLLERQNAAVLGAHKLQALRH
mmetsp:Transcript_5355/g.13551  ORF Transcript_5355/g.13551 Transcript_5355/m.13551 type:complete len:238 (-) Transcript_5355:545-1258(-)